MRKLNPNLWDDYINQNKSNVRNHLQRRLLRMNTFSLYSKTVYLTINSIAKSITCDNILFLVV